jgi:hypothetical protein
MRVGNGLAIIMTGDGNWIHYLQFLKQNKGQIYRGVWSHPFPGSHTHFPKTTTIGGAHLARGQIRSQAAGVSILQAP